VEHAQAQITFISPVQGFGDPSADRYGERRSIPAQRGPTRPEPELYQQPPSQPRYSNADIYDRAVRIGSPRLLGADEALPEFERKVGLTCSLAPSSRSSLERCSLSFAFAYISFIFTC
jgi:hypothetical protein